MAILGRDWEAPTSIQQHILGIVPGPASVEVAKVVVETAGGTWDQLGPGRRLVGGSTYPS